MTVNYSTSVDYTSNQFGNPAFLQALITDGSVTFNHKMLDWKYANRREAQMVLPFLFVGPLSAAKDEAFVRETGFTLLISVRNNAPGSARMLDACKLAEKYGIEYYNLDIDSPTDMIRKFPAAIKAINDHLEKSTMECSSHKSANFQSMSIGGKVLVFCETGNEKSASLVAAYLMAVFGIDEITAMQTVQSQRFSMCMDDTVKIALGTFGSLLTAKRDVGRASGLYNGEHKQEKLRQQFNQESGAPTRKRTLDAIYNDEDHMDIHGPKPGEEYSGRTGEAPFHDIEDSR